MTPSPFQIGQGIGNTFGQVQERQNDLSAIDQILANAGQTGDTAAYDNAIGQILSRVSPQRQQRAIDVLQGRQERMQQQQSQGQMTDKQIAEQRESSILAKVSAGEQITPEERATLSPTSLRTLIGQQKPTFEPTEERLEAERVSQLATEIEGEYKASQSEEQRLGRMEKLSDKGDISTPAMMKTMNTLGLPLGILGNPDSEEYAKLEADFLRDVRNVFPGGRITNYEIQAYLKTVPSLMNSKEGKAAIIRNRRLQNQAKNLRYSAYKDIIKENGGRKPRNLGVLIDERTGDQMREIEEQFREGIQTGIEKFQQPLRMKDSSGKSYNIPPNLVEKALKDGLLF
jgi:hypothetical protein